MQKLLITVGVLFLAACGSKRPGWADSNRDLLDEVELKAPGAAAPRGPKRFEAARPVIPLTSQQAATRRCVGFTPDGSAALLIDELRTSGAQGEQVKIRAIVAKTPGASTSLVPMALAQFDPTQNEDALLGDGLEKLVEQHLEALNTQIATAALVGCQAAEDSDEGGGFKRKIKHLLAYPGGHATRIAIRDHGLYVSPEGQASRSVREIPEGSNLKLSEVYFLADKPNLVIVITEESRDGVRAEIVMVEASAK